MPNDKYRRLHYGTESVLRLRAERRWICTLFLFCFWLAQDRDVAHIRNPLIMRLDTDNYCH